MIFLIPRNPDFDQVSVLKPRYWRLQTPKDDLWMTGNL